jgi:predicted O-methyltransferase YrrM
MTLNIVDKHIESYLDTLLPQRAEWFLEMEALAREESFPAIGPHIGQLLEILARSTQAERILELGSGYGYSGLWFARALPEDGFILLSDFEEKNKSIAEKYFRMAGKQHLMTFKVGDANDLLNTLLNENHPPFDIIFNDIDKELYPQTIEPVYRLLRDGGLFITDNTLWEGKVIESDPAKLDEPTAAVKAFNEGIKAHPGFIASWLPIRDGVCIARKANMF